MICIQVTKFINLKERITKRERASENNTELCYIEKISRDHDWDRDIVQPLNIIFKWIEGLNA